MAEIVQSLFGVTPESYQMAQQQRADAQALRYAELDPFQQANFAIGRGAYQLGGAIGGALGGQDPELQRITARQQIAQNLDINNPASFQNAMSQLVRLGDIEGQRQLQPLMDEALKRSQASASRQRSAEAQNLIQSAYRPAVPEQQQFVEVDDQGQPVAIPGRPASFDISPVVPQLMRLGPEGQAAISQQAKLLPDLRRLGAASMREENPFATFLADETIPKNVKTLAQQYSKSFASGVLDPEKADVRVRELADMTQRVQQFEQNQQQIKDNQAIMQSLRQQGLENSQQALLIQQGNLALQAQNVQFQQEMKRKDAEAKEDARKNKPLPSFLAKQEDADFEKAQATSNLAIDANTYINRIKTGEIPFGLKNTASIRARQLLGSSDPDVIAREDYDKFVLRLTNETLRLNKGIQTNFDFENAFRELKSSDSPEAAAAVMKRIVDANVRTTEDLAKQIETRRKNSGFAPPQMPVDVPKIDVQIINNNDYNSFLKNPKYPSGTVFIDPKGVRRVKP